MNTTRHTASLSKESSTQTSGFTLIELLVVIAVIAVLSMIVMASLNIANEKSRIAKVVEQMRELRIGTSLYITDTSFIPPSCGLTCVEATDPFITAPAGVSRWNGPYMTSPVWNMETPWKGHLTVETKIGTDANNDGMDDTYFYASNDLPGTTASNNMGVIPPGALQKIDALIDDGNLATGDARGNGQGFGSEVGEIVVIFKP